MLAAGAQAQAARVTTRDLKAEAGSGSNYIEVLYTTPQMQGVAMSLAAGVTLDFKHVNRTQVTQIVRGTAEVFVSNTQLQPRPGDVFITGSNQRCVIRPAGRGEVKLLITVAPPLYRARFVQQAAPRQAGVAASSRGAGFGRGEAEEEVSEESDSYEEEESRPAARSHRPSSSASRSTGKRSTGGSRSTGGGGSRSRTARSHFR